VPDVTGEDAADAVARLSDEGFRIRQRQQDVDSPEGDGVVIEQNPAGGRAPRGSTVTITVGRFTGTTTQQQQTTPQQGTTTGGNGNATPGTTPGTTDGTSG
jgi:serine/threonine-protein kinase